MVTKNNYLQYSWLSQPALIFIKPASTEFTSIQGGAGHLGSPEQGKRAKIFFEKGLFRAQNRATKTRCEGVFRCRGTLLQ